MRPALAAALLALTASAAAEPGGQMLARAESSDWGALDQDLVSLSAVTTGAGGIELGAYVRSHYESSSDEAFSSDGEDRGGWAFRAVRVEGTGSVGERLGFKVSIDFKTGEADLKDAYAVWGLLAREASEIALTWGRFKEPISHAGLTSGSRQLFVDRTALGGANDERDLGAMLGGSHGRFEWALAAQNGSDSALDEHLLTARGVAHVIGDGAFGKYQGAYGNGGGTGASVGVAWQDDGSAADGDFALLELAGSWTDVYAHAEIADLDDDYDGPKSGVTPFKHLVPDSTPWSLMGSYLFGDDEFEAALLYEDADDPAHTTRVIAGLNWYPADGHDVKWQVNVVEQSSDSDALEGTNVLVGLVIRA